MIVHGVRLLFVVCNAILSPHDFYERLKIWNFFENEKRFVLMWRCATEENKSEKTRPVGGFFRLDSVWGTKEQLDDWKQSEFSF